MKPSHRRHAPAQQAWIVFAGRADHGWQRWLRPGFRHCFAALHDGEGWLVVEALTGRLLVSRLAVTPGFDVPNFYRRAEMTVLGPFTVREATGGGISGRLPGWLPLNCVNVCRALIGPHAPTAWTPHGLYRGLLRSDVNRKKFLTFASDPG